jgi:hypothetical protein
MRLVAYTCMTATRLSGPAREYFPSLGSIATLRFNAEDLPVSPVWLVSLGDPRLAPSVAGMGAAHEATIIVACTMQLQVIALLRLRSNLAFAAQAFGSVASK